MKKIFCIIFMIFAYVQIYCAQCFKAQIFDEGSLYLCNLAENGCYVMNCNNLNEGSELSFYYLDSENNFSKFVDDSSKEIFKFDAVKKVLSYQSSCASCFIILTSQGKIYFASCEPKKINWSKDDILDSFLFDDIKIKNFGPECFILEGFSKKYDRDYYVQIDANHLNVASYGDLDSYNEDDFQVLKKDDSVFSLYKGEYTLMNLKFKESVFDIAVAEVSTAKKPGVCEICFYTARNNQKCLIYDERRNSHDLNDKRPFEDSKFLKFSSAAEVLKLYFYDRKKSCVGICTLNDSYDFIVEKNISCPAEIKFLIENFTLDDFISSDYLYGIQYHCAKKGNQLYLVKNYDQ